MSAFADVPTSPKSPAKYAADRDTKFLFVWGILWGALWKDAISPLFATPVNPWGRYQGNALIELDSSLPRHILRNAASRHSLLRTPEIEHIGSLP